MVKLDYEDLEDRTRNCGVPFAEILRRADTNYRTWFRWKKGEVDPLGRFNRIEREVEKLEEEHITE